MKDKTITDKNTKYWDELCGTALAKYLGISDFSPESLKKYDDYYFDLYPYIYDYIPLSKLKGKNVLEVGLGYGTVSSYIAESDAIYTGLDVANGPVNMVNNRLKQLRVSGQAVQGSILNPPFEKGIFDVIIAIGCLHHTGDLQLALDKCRGLLSPGGELIFMVYNAYSYRRFIQSPVTTVKYFLKEMFSYRSVVGKSTEKQRAGYDANTESLEGAPHTDWISIRSLRALCRDFSSFSGNLENIDREPPFFSSTRKELLTTKWPAVCGLDLYAVAKK